MCQPATSSLQTQLQARSKLCMGSGWRRDTICSHVVRAQRSSLFAFLNTCGLAHRASVGSSDAAGRGSLGRTSAGRASTESSDLATSVEAGGVRKQSSGLARAKAALQRLALF